MDGLRVGTHVDAAQTFCDGVGLGQCRDGDGSRRLEAGQAGPGLLGAVALLLQQSADKSATSALVFFLALLLVVAGAILCVSWRRLLLEYGDRLRERFLYLRKLELEYSDLLLPAFSERPRQQSFSRMEAGIPRVFLVTYFLAVAGALAYAFGAFGAFAPLQALLPK